MYNLPVFVFLGLKKDFKSFFEGEVNLFTITDQ